MFSPKTVLVLYKPIHFKYQETEITESNFDSKNIRMQFLCTIKLKEMTYNKNSQNLFVNILLCYDQGPKILCLLTYSKQDSKMYFYLSFFSPAFFVQGWIWCPPPMVTVWEVGYTLNRLQVHRSINGLNIGSTWPSSAWPLDVSTHLSSFLRTYLIQAEEDSNRLLAIVWPESEFNHENIYFKKSSPPFAAALFAYIYLLKGQHDQHHENEETQMYCICAYGCWQALEESKPNGLGLQTPAIRGKVTLTQPRHFWNQRMVHVLRHFFTLFAVAVLFTLERK